MNNEEYKFLSRCIYTARQNKCKEDLELPLIALFDMYDKDDWLMLPAWHDKNNNPYMKPAIAPEYTLDGKLLPVNTEGRFFRNEFGTDLIATSVRRIFKVALENKNCGGLILNPNTDCEGMVNISVIKAIVEYFKKNEVKKK